MVIGSLCFSTAWFVYSLNWLKQCLSFQLLFSRYDKSFKKKTDFFFKIVYWFWVNGSWQIKRIQKKKKKNLSILTKRNTQFAIFSSSCLRSRKLFQCSWEMHFDFHYVSTRKLLFKHMWFDAAKRKYNTSLHIFVKN